MTVSREEKERRKKKKTMGEDCVTDEAEEGERERRRRTGSGIQVTVSAVVMRLRSQRLEEMSFHAREKE